MPVDSLGELLVEGPSVAHEYFAEPEKRHLYSYKALHGLQSMVRVRMDADGTRLVIWYNIKAMEISSSTAERTRSLKFTASVLRLQRLSTMSRGLCKERSARS
jgi:hypothetical protein